MIAVPIKALAAAVTVGLVFPLHGPAALRANREANYAIIRTSEAANLGDRHGFPEGHLRPDLRGDQQVVGRQVKAGTEFFQRQDRRRSLAPGDVGKVSGAEIAPFRGGFIAELAGITQFENGRG